MPVAEHFSPTQMKSDAKTLYPDGPALRRLIQVHRPLICPFGEIILEVPEGATLLDIGCGSGLFIGLLARHRDISAACGFDASAPAVALAQQMQASHPSADKITFEHRAVGAPWPDQVFDVVTIIDLFHHLTPVDQATTFKNAVNRLKPGGKLVFKDMGRAPAWRAFFSHLHDIVISREFIHIPAESDIETWARENHVKLTKRATYNMWWYGHELWVFEKPVSAVE
tara:strand:+ start:5501 stop:6178 length:678 start_codon:yes stop_codon:yes gene_type:complete